MSSNWPRVSLGEVLTRTSETTSILPQNKYKEVTIKLWGKGVTQRREALGSEIAADWRYVVRPKQFILSRIDARNGAFGLVPDFLDNAVVTNDFPSFNINDSRLEPAFLGWLSRTADFVEWCKAASEGTTNRVRLVESRFLNIDVPLPPLETQRRIVVKIEALAAKIEEARGLQGQVIDMLESLCRSFLFNDTENQNILTPMNELVKLRQPDVVVQKNESYHFAGVYSFGRGVFRGSRKMGTEFAYPKLSRLRTHDFVYPKLMAWEGALGVVPPECDDLVVSTEFPVFEINQSRVLPEVLDVYFKTPSVWPLISGDSTGTNVRRRRLNPKDYLSHKIPLPPMLTQNKIRQTKIKLNKIKTLQNNTRLELNALLPSILAKAFAGDL